MGSKSINYDEDFSNGESSKGNDTSLIVNVNDTQSDIDEHEESNYSENENGETAKKRSRNDDSSKRSPHKDKNRGKVDLSKTRYLWVSGIPDGTKTSQLEELFLQYGKVLAIKIIRGGSDSTLLGFVKLETIEQAQKCMEKLNRTEFRGNKIELLKERPIDKDAGNKKPEKIGFRDTRKPFIPRPAVPRPHFRPPHQVSTRGAFRPPMHTTHREHARLTPDFRRQEREEYIRLEREKERLKLERMKLERDKAELFKIERESRVFDRERIHDDKRVRSMVKRPPIEEPFLEEKRYDDYNRREDFGRRYEPSSRSSPERKINSTRPFASRGRGYEDNSRQERYSDKYESSKSWTSLSDGSWPSNDNHRHWQSSNYESPRILSSSIGSSSLSRLHSSAELPQNPRGYFSGSSRRY